MIPTDLLSEWKRYEVSGQVIKAMREEKERLLAAMSFGQFVRKKKNGCLQPCRLVNS